MPFALGGGLACWAYGAPESDHDIDLMVLPADAERAQTVLADIGMKPVNPPEGWLRKAYDGDILVDIIFEPNGVPLEPAALERAQVREVAAVPMPVLALEDVISSKLLALNEHFCDFEKLLGIARAVREQVDWERVRTLTRDSPFAAAFFTLVERLGIAPPMSVSSAGVVRLPA